jgi:hypothetical protein
MKMRERPAAANARARDFTATQNKRALALLDDIQAYAIVLTIRSIVLLIVLSHQGIHASVLARRHDGRTGCELRCGDPRRGLCGGRPVAVAWRSQKLKLTRNL